MKPIPFIVGFGGLSAAGRSAFHTAYNRLVIEEINQTDRLQTFASLAIMMNLVNYEKGKFYTAEKKNISLAEIEQKYGDNIKQNTLIRKIPKKEFFKNSLFQNLKITLTPSEFQQIKSLSQNQSFSTPTEAIEVFLAAKKPSKVMCAGCLPTGFKVASHYPSLHHPETIQLAIFGVSDALHSVGIDWEEIQHLVSPDAIGVYCGSCSGAMDSAGNAGLLQAAFKAKRPSSKMMPFSMMNMISDFINAYVLGNIGFTSTTVGACATFLYNMHNAYHDIQAGRIKVAIVGASEAPVTPEIVEGYRVMGALADDEKIKNMNGGKLDYRTACRPFGENCGFTLAEGSQFVILFSDDLVIQTGANPYSAVGGIYVCADGYKNSISKPGGGNYITFAKATALAKSILGEEKLKKNTYIQAHGTGTPQNRVTESHILNETAKAFGIKDWKVAAVKTYLGHSTGPAAGDQLVSSLGVWQQGIIPAIKNTPKIAKDVFCSHLNILLNHENVKNNPQDACLINAKGFGGNNSTALFLSPTFSLDLLEKKYQKVEMQSFFQKNSFLVKNLDTIKQELLYGIRKPIYFFGKEQKLDVKITDSQIKFSSLNRKIKLKTDNPYE